MLSAMSSKENIELKGPHSGMLQLVDIASYLQLQLERRDLEDTELTPYRKSTVEHAVRIDSKLIRGSRTKIPINLS